MLKIIIVFFMRNLCLFFVLFMFIFSACDYSAVDDDLVNFSVSAEDLIDSVVIVGDDVLILSKVSGDWYVNLTYRAELGVVSNFFQIISLMKMNTLLPDAAVAGVSKSLKSGILVEIYGGGVLLRSYYLGDYVPELGNYMMLSSSLVPCVVHVPSYDFDLRDNFSSAAVFWASKVLFSQSVSEIRSLEVSNYEFDKFFYVDFAGDEPVLHDKRGGDLIVNDFDLEKLKVYLQRFSDVRFEDFFSATDSVLVDSFLLVEPIFEITMITNLDKMINLKAFPVERSGLRDDDVFIGLLDSSRLLLAKYYDFDLLLKDYSYFKRGKN